MPRSARVRHARAALIQRLRSGAYAPGDRFLSNRGAAEKLGVSYQTAHRLLDELAAEGLLERRGQSGTFIPGAPRPRGVELRFHPRAAVPGSFGRKLLTGLTDRLARDRIDHTARLTDRADPLPAPDRLPVLWEVDTLLARLITADRPAVLLNDRPPLGLGSLHIDSLSPDDFGGGVLAAQLLQSRQPPPGRARAAVLAGPADDARSRLRVEGFRSVLPAAVIHAGGWYFEHGYAAAARLTLHPPAALFCCNDRLAQAAIARFREAGRPVPPIVGFDDAPIAEELGLTTIAIPWDAIIDAAAATIRRRLTGAATGSSHQILNPRPVTRRF